MMKKITLLCTLLMGINSFAQLFINEVDADQTSTDTTEFLELKSDVPNFALDGYVVVLYNGSNDLSYNAIDLAGFTTDANGYFIIGSDATPGVDIALGPDNTIQNGADAIAIYTGTAADFPMDTPVTSVNLVDAIVYGTSDDDDLELLAGLGETVQYDENLNGLKDTESLQLNTDGSFCTTLPTLRADNSCGPLGINDFNTKPFTIYPNPAQGYLNITSSNAGEKQVVIYDVLGKKVVTSSLNGERMNISQLNSGVYIIQITQGAISETKKLVVK
ncbi:MAG: T9SS type A sorting domain-containing protein [Flavobacteriaceae bacterium]